MKILDKQILIYGLLFILMPFLVVMNDRVYSQTTATYTYEESIIALSGDGTFVAVTGRSSVDSTSETEQRFIIDIYDTLTGELVHEYDGSEFPVKFLSLNQDGQLLAFANNGGTLSIVDTASLENIRTLAHGYRDVGIPTWSSDEQFFAYTDGGAISIFDADTFQSYAVLIDANSPAGVVGYEWHPNMARIVASMFDPNNQLWSTSIWNIIGEQNATLDKSFDIRSGSRLSWSPNGEFIVTNQRGGIKIIDVAAGTETFLAIFNPEEPIYSVDWSSDGTKIVGGGSQVYIWDVETGTIIENILTENSVRNVFWSPDSQHIYHTGGSAGVYRDGIPLHEA